MGILKEWRKNWKFFFCILWPTVLLPVLIYGQSTTAYCGYAVAVLAGFWMTEAVPIAITSLMPMFLYPLLGIQSSDILAHEYLKDSILTFIGGLIIALAIEFSGLHKRIALRVILFTGTSMKMLMLGIMLCTMFLSMWMSNTAVAAMMVPIIMAVLEELEKSLNQVYQAPANLSISLSTLASSSGVESVYSEPMPDLASQRADSTEGIVIKQQAMDTEMESSPEKLLQLKEFMTRVRTMFLLSCCYSCNIGGTGVITGSGTNLVAIEFLGNLDPAHHGDHAALTFTTWMAFNAVPMLINITIAWVYLQLNFMGFPPCIKFWSKGKSNADELITPKIEGQIRKMLETSYQELGDITVHEMGVTGCFLFVVASWIFHDPRFIPGWSQFFPLKVSVSTTALATSVLFFVFPRNLEFYHALRTGDFTNVRFKPLLEWDFVQRKFPWGVVILLGGGYAMSNGAKKSGLSYWIGQSLKSLSVLPPHGILGILCVSVAFLTEIASNTATATIAIPILMELSQELNIHPLYLTLPATVVCSYAFMLPVATPPNAIVYAASDMKVTDMIKAGLFMNCACVLVLYLSTITYGNLVFHFSSYNYIP